MKRSGLIREVLGALLIVSSTAGLSCAQGAGAASQASPRPPDTGKGGRGYGLVVKITNNTRIDPQAFDAVRDNPDVTAVQVLITWAQLEPQRGQYRWDIVEQVLAEYGKIGKSVAFSFVTVSGKVPTPGQLRKGKKRAGADESFQNLATPGWFFEDAAARRLGGIETPGGRIPLYPVFWDPVYQRELRRFIAAFGQRFDGDPRIEFIRMGGWQIETNEPSFYGGATMLLREQLEREGETVGGRRKPRLDADSRYAGAVKALVDAWSTSFRRTRLAATVHFSDDPRTFEYAMIQHCAGQGCVLLNTGLNEGDKREARQRFRDFRQKYGCQVGWGGITHLGQKGGADGEDEAEEIDSPPPGVRSQAMQQAVGSSDDPGLRPASEISYVVVGLDFLQDSATTRWIARRLVP